MQRIILALIAVISATAVTACALDDQDEQSAQSAVTSQSVTPDAFPASCPSGDICLYENSQFTGTELAIPNGGVIANLFDVNFNDKLSSWCNHTNRQYCYWFNANFTGTRVIIIPNTCHASVSPGNNDQASSVKPCS